MESCTTQTRSLESARRRAPGCTAWPNISRCRSLKSGLFEHLGIDFDPNDKYAKRTLMNALESTGAFRAAETNHCCFVRHHEFLESTTFHATHCAQSGFRMPQSFLSERGFGSEKVTDGRVNPLHSVLVLSSNLRSCSFRYPCPVEVH